MRVFKSVFMALVADYKDLCLIERKSLKFQANYHCSLRKIVVVREQSFMYDEVPANRNRGLIYLVTPHLAYL